MEISREQFEKSKDYYNKYRKLMERHQSIMNKYIRSNKTLPMEYNTSIEDLDLGVRLERIILHQTNIRTLGELVKTKPNDMMRLRNFGKKNYRTLKEFLNDMGIEWGH